MDHDGPGLRQVLRLEMAASPGLSSGGSAAPTGSARKHGSQRGDRPGPGERREQRDAARADSSPQRPRTSQSPDPKAPLGAGVGTGGNTVGVAVGVPALPVGVAVGPAPGPTGLISSCGFQPGLTPDPP